MVDKLSKYELRDKVLKSKARVVMSAFIRTGTSDLYDFNPGVRATLREIAFLQCTDEKGKYPEDAPEEFKADRVGWCWASQWYIARRVGKSESQVQRDITRFQKEGVIEERTWRDSNGYKHAEYHLLDDVIEAHQRPEDKDAPRPKRNRRDYQANKGSFSSSHQPKSHAASQPLPASISAVATPHLSREQCRMPAVSHAASHETSTAGMRLKGVDFRGLTLDGLQTVHDTGREPVSSAPDGAGLKPSAPPRSSVMSQIIKRSSKPKPPSGLSMEPNEEPETRPQGVALSGEKKPLPNRLCYPEAFAHWKTGMKVPKCYKCGDTLHPNENHKCPGYIPNGADMDDFEAEEECRWQQTFDREDEDEEDDEELDG